MHPSARTHAYTVCALTKYTPTTFSDQRLVSITKPQEGFLCQMCVNSVFTQTTYTQDKFRHVHHMEIVPFRLTANFQPDLSLSVSWSGFPFAPLRQDAPSDCSSLEFPNHLGHTLTEAPLSIITRLTWVPGSHSLAVFLSSVLSTPQPLLAHVYNIDFVFNRVNVLLSRLGIWVLDINLVHHLVVVCS